MSRIESIQIQNFRGIRKLDLRLDKGNLLLLGENGTGKSSVIDALELFFTGQVEKFSGRADVKERDCIPNANGGKPSVAVQFTNETAPITVNFPYRKPTVPLALTKFFDNAKARPFILHRAQLLRFIESKPADRYKVVSDLIGLDQLEKIEKNWKECRDNAESSFKTEQELYRRALAELTDHLKPVSNPGDLIPISASLQSDQDVINKIRQRMERYSLPTIQCREDVQTVRQTVLAKSRSPKDIARAEQLRILQRKCTQVQNDLTKTGEIYYQLVEAREDLIGKMECLDDAIFETLLQEGRRLITVNNFDQCPLCEQGIQNQGQLLARIESRLIKLEALTFSKRNLQGEKSTAKETGIALNRDLRLLEDDLADLELSAQLPVLNSIHEPVEIWRKHLDAENESQNAFHNLLETSEIQSLRSQLAGLSEYLDTEIRRLTPNATEQELFEIADFLGRLDQLWGSWQNLRHELNTTRTVFTQVDKIYLELVEARKEGLDELLTELQTEFVRLFEKLHPNEGFQAISLVISKEKRSSIGMESTIEGHQSMHPYGNYSEGHLDSLGLCLFLAFIRSFNADFKLIVLDDVLTSIDAGHRIRVARLLAEEFSDYQIILTTHDEMWANELKVMMSSRELKLRFLRFKPWDLSRGSDIDEFVASDWEFYQQLVNDGRKQDAIAGAGRSLEKFLFQMRRNLGVSVPATLNDVYTIGDLYGPFFSWVDKHLFTRADRPDVTNDLKNYKEELDGYWRLRNWSGAHYNEWGATVSPPEAKSFIQIIEELISIFECPVCTGLVVFDRNANLLHCPICKPAPTPTINWVYRADWRERARRLIQPGPRQSYRSSLGLTRSVFEFFLRDMRWIARLAVPPVQGDRYHVQDLFVPFSNWASQHPSQTDTAGSFERMAGFLDDQNCWQEDSLLIPRAEQLYQVADELIKLFECPTCQTLMHYSSRYYCPQCSGNVNETPRKQPARWPVVRTS